MDDCDIWTGTVDAEGFPIHRTYKTVNGIKQASESHVHESLWKREYGSLPDGRTVGHKCGNKSCVNVDHLIAIDQEQYTTLYQSQEGQKRRRHWAAKLTEQQVLEILQLFESGEKPYQIAKAYGIHISALNALLKGETWSHVSLDGKPRINTILSEQENFRTPQCVRYEGTIDPKGYPRLSTRSDGRQKHLLAHYRVWEDNYGPVPVGFNVVQYCNYRACVNPEHLRLVTRQQAVRLTRFESPSGHGRARGERHGNSKLSAEDVAYIKELLREGQTKAAVAKAFGVTQAAIAAIEAGRVWRDRTNIDSSPAAQLRVRQQYLDSLAKVEITGSDLRQFASTVLVLGRVYTRNDLVELLKLEPTYQLKNGSVVKLDVARFRSVLIFVTGPLGDDLSENGMPDSDTVHFLPPRHTEEDIIQHSTTEKEVCVFHRVSKAEYGSGYGFQYKGVFCFVGRRAEGARYFCVLQRASDDLLEAAKRDIEAFAIEHEDPIHREGTKYRVLGSRFERDPVCRAAAIRYHGTKCQACGFSFESTYGPHGANYIQVHHIKPLSSYEARAKVDPIADMAVLCSNCHSMIHRDPNEPLSVEQLRFLIKTNAHKAKST